MTPALERALDDGDPDLEKLVVAELNRTSDKLGDLGDALAELSHNDPQPPAKLNPTPILELANAGKLRKTPPDQTQVAADLESRVKA
jgi:hypothetical protein